MRKNILGQSAAGVLLCCIMPGLAAAPGNTNQGANPNGKPFIELQGQIIEVEGEVSTLQDQVQSLVDDVDDLELRVIANDDAIAGLEATNADLQLQITANQDDIASLQSEVAMLETDNEDLQTQINALGDADGELQAAINSNASLITTLNQSIADLGITLQAQIANNENLILIMQDQIANLGEVAAEKARIEDGVCASGETIQSYNPSTGYFACQRIWVDSDGTSAWYPVVYKTLTVAAGRTANGFVGCDLYYPQYGLIANLSFSQSGGLDLRQWRRVNNVSYRYTWTNSTSESQVVNMAVECLARY